MYAGQLVFAQLMDFLPRHEFNACVRRYDGNVEEQTAPWRNFANPQPDAVRENLYYSSVC